MPTALNLPPLILASASPRRRELLSEMGFTFQVEPARVEEVHDPTAPLLRLTRENAALKAWEVSERFPNALVIGADTLVFIESTPLGKPADFSEACAMLRRLSGNEHEVCTAVCLTRGVSFRSVCFEVVTRVQFRRLTEQAIDNYLARIDPLDKAGAYAAQEHGEMIIEKMDGSFTNVVGLPTERLAVELRLWQSHT